MKLYATVTSERATKGQGGNKYLSISIRGVEGILLATIDTNEVGDIEVKTRPYTKINVIKDKDLKPKTWTELETKGKKQKDNRGLLGGETIFGYPKHK